MVIAVASGFVSPCDSCCSKQDRGAHSHRVPPRQSSSPPWIYHHWWQGETQGSALQRATQALAGLTRTYFSIQRTYFFIFQCKAANCKNWPSWRILDSYCAELCCQELSPLHGIEHKILLAVQFHVSTFSPLSTRVRCWFSLSWMKIHFFVVVNYIWKNIFVGQSVWERLDLILTLKLKP